jgi:hypothetical protein
MKIKENIMIGAKSVLQLKYQDMRQKLGHNSCFDDVNRELCGRKLS